MDFQRLCQTSPRGKRQRLKFDTKAAAEDHRTKLAATIASPRLKRFDDKLLETANYYNETFQIYGFPGLAEACAAFVSQLDKTTVSMSLTELIESYREARGQTGQRATSTPSIGPRSSSKTFTPSNSSPSMPITGSNGSQNGENLATTQRGLPPIGWTRSL